MSLNGLSRLAWVRASSGSGSGSGRVMVLSTATTTRRSSFVLGGPLGWGGGITGYMREERARRGFSTSLVRERSFSSSSSSPSTPPPPPPPPPPPRQVEPPGSSNFSFIRNGLLFTTAGLVVGLSFTFFERERGERGDLGGFPAGLVNSDKNKDTAKDKDSDATNVKSQKPVYGTPQEFQAAISELREIFKETETKDGDGNEDEEGGERAEVEVSTHPDVLEEHGFSVYDYHPSVPPSVVVYPLCTDDVVRIVNVATKYRMPVIPYSGATSLEGHFRGHPSGGICVDLSRMDKILAIHENDADLVCQPGARWMDINATLAEMGVPLFWPIDPAPGATIGGLLSTGCSGTNAVRYGTARGEWFLNATVVLPNGKVIKTRQRARKSSAGWDTTKLFIGAEGTLGIVTEVTIRLAPILPTTVAVAQFPSVKHATSAVQEILQSGVGIQCVELVDSVFMKAANAYGVTSGAKNRKKYTESDSLFFKLQGPTPRSLEETSSIVQGICKKYGASGYEVARSKEEAEDMWSDRKNAHYSGLAMVPGAKGWPTDVCVPVSNLPQLVAETKEDLDSIGLVSTIVGHVGDGNFHALILFTNDAEFAKAKEAVDRMVWRAIALDGTCTGEHGVGLGKKKYLMQELGIETVEFMKSIKRAVDPLGLFNPGKLYPDIEDSVFAPRPGDGVVARFEELKSEHQERKSSGGQ